MNKFITNPFDRSALTDSKLLAGRKIEFRQIRFLLRNASRQENRIKSIMICGDRGVGKTSFLNLIEVDCASNNIVPIRLNLTETNSQNSNEFFWYLFSRTLNTLYSLNYFGGIGGDIHNSIQKIINTEETPDEVNWVFKTPFLHRNYLKNKNSTFEFDQLIEDLKLVRRQLTNEITDKFNNQTKLLFLVDESQNIYSNKKIIEEIRFIIQNQDLGFGFVFAGDTSYEKSQWDNVFGGAHREFEIINLNYFEDVDGVKEYFRKSLESVDWTTKEIEEDLFYRFHHACMHIHALTSGKPAWINEIAQKMFERCMKGESNILRFDRNAQNDVKNILLSSGQIDKVKLDIIDSMSPKLKKWLSKIFASELSTLRQVYFYARFVLTGENSLSFDDYTSFIKTLIEAGIIVLQTSKETKDTIGYQLPKQQNPILDTPYFAFGINSDSFKLWLQINSDGRYRFRIISPDVPFVEYINSELSTESGNIFILASSIGDDSQEDITRLSIIIDRIIQNKLDVNEASYGLLSIIYKLLMRIANSNKKQILYIQLKDNISNKKLTWNIYNTNEHDKLIEFNDSKIKIHKLKSIIENIKDNETDYTLDISVDKLNDLNIEHFQNLIIKTGDSKKRSIVIDDKISALVKHYIDEQNVDSSYKVACFLYNLFEEGHDFSIRDLNNTAYVFIVKDEFERANSLLKEAMTKINNEQLEIDELSSAMLVYYNMAIIFFKNKEYENCLKYFKKAIAFCENQEGLDDSAGVLCYLESSNNEIHIKELQAKDTQDNSLNSKDMSIKNISILETYLKNKIC